MLEVQNLCRNFRGIAAIESVSFKVAPGEIVEFLGRNGAGKSTTVTIITGMLRANEGRVLSEGQDVRKNMVAFRSAFGCVPEDAHLYNVADGRAVLSISHVLEVVAQVCNRVIVIAKGKLLADAPPAGLTTLMRLPTLESLFAQLVQQQDTRSIAQEIVAVMQLNHA